MVYIVSHFAASDIFGPDGRLAVRSLDLATAGLEYLARLPLERLHDLPQPRPQPRGELGLRLVDGDLPDRVETVRDVHRDSDQLRELAMSDQPEPSAVHDQPMLTIDVEALISDEAFLAAQPFMFGRGNLREMREDEGLDAERPSLEL